MVAGADCSATKLSYRTETTSWGSSYDLKSPVRFLQPGLGGQFMLFQSPENLRAIYGSYAKGMQVWLRMWTAPRLN